MHHQVQETLGESTRAPYELEEGHVTKTMKKRASRVPSSIFLWAAGASILGSLTLRIMGQRNASLFVGQWAPTFLLFGVYNQQAKAQGHG